MTLKSDTKLEEKLTLGSKNNMRNLMNFNASSGKSENLHLDVLLLSVVVKFQELSLLALKKDSNFEE